MTTRSRRDPLVLIGLSTVALAAAISSFEALHGVALTAGWTRAMAPMFPITIDATALVATRIWLAASTPTDAARRFARTVAIGAVLVSLLGNGTFHLAQAHVIHAGVGVVIAAGAVPPLALAVVCHLAVLRSAEAITTQVAAPEEATHQQVHLLPADAEPVVVMAEESNFDVDNKPDTTRTPRRVDTATQVAKLVAKHPDMKPAVIAAKLGVSDRTVRRHLAALAAA